jgi:hypothetical protein
MVFEAEKDEQLRVLKIAYERAGLTVDQLWLRYFALGGNAGRIEVDAYLHGLMPLPELQRDVLAHAVNERLDELAWPRRVPYNRPVRNTKPDRGPLAALVGLLDGARLAPPERLPALAAAAGAEVGVDVMIYLVDYEQRRLIPLPTPEHSVREPLGVDTTLAGRAFRIGQTLPARNEDILRLWVPLLDGTERLGVLEVMVADLIELYDPGLREQCRWLSGLLGHLVTISTDYGDALDSRRRRRRRSPAAELIWSLLPPLTAGTDSFVLAGMLEPCYEIGGDAFDYAVSETTVSLAVFDAMGHALGAGLIAAAALATYRSVRRDRRSLYDQATAIDQTVTDNFAGAFLTGVLAEIDLPSGRLRYLCAGHPPPLLLRDGKIVKTLSGGRRAPLGLDATDVAIGEETLQPGDWLVLHTDGITEARDSTGAFFGETRLVDFLEREAASGHPPPETVRRLIRAVLNHQNGVLQDDATVLLARWDASGVTHPRSAFAP